MKSGRPWLLLTLAVLVSSGFVAQEKTGTELLITVQLPDGSPAKGIKLQQVQLERTSPFPRNFVCGITDSAGQLTVKYVPMRSQGDDRNGYGIYRYVLMPAGFRWEFSDLYYWNKEPWSELVLPETDVWSYESYQEIMHSPTSRGTNWSVGNLVRIKAGERINWKVSLQPGRDVQVSAIDQFGQPIARKSLSVFLDAGVLSRTSFGGEIQISTVQTDDQGMFTLPRAGEFWYSFEYPCNTRTLDSCEYCAPDEPAFTRIVRGRFDQAAGSIKYYKRIPKSITIIVRDKFTQRPIPGAAINAMMVFPAGAQGGMIGKTDQEGRYSTEKLFTEHLAELVAVREGYKEFKFDMKNFVSGSTCTFDMESK